MKQPAIVLIFILFCAGFAFSQETVQSLGNTPIDVFNRHQIERLNDEIKEKPQDAGLYLDRAYYLKELKEIPAFLKDVSTILNLKPEFSDTFYRNLASVVISKVPGETEKYLKALNSSNPKHCFPYKLRLVELVKQKDYKGAIDNGIKAIEQIPSEVCGLDPILDSLFALREDKAVFEYYERVFNSFEKKLSQLRASNAQFPSKSKEYISAVINADKFASTIHFLCYRWALTYNMVGEVKKENEVLEKMLRIEPRYSAYESRRRFFQQTKNSQRIEEDSLKLKEAKIEKLTREIDLYELSPVMKASSYFERGDAYLELKQYDKAIADYQTAKTVYPQQVPIADWRIQLANKLIEEKNNSPKQNNPTNRTNPNLINPANLPRYIPPEKPL